MTEKQNASSQFPRVFYCRHMQPGTARYEDETILVDTDGMKRLIASGIGKPVYINHQAVDLNTMKEKACGYITESFYNNLDGWAWFKFLAIDDEAHAAINQNWSVSNAYKPSDWGNGGTKNNVPYDREVLNGEITHLAIVPDPRYEGACIMTTEQFKNYQEVQESKLKELHNSKNPKGKPMLNFFKNTKTPVAATEIDADTLVEVNGKEISVKEMINSVTNSKTKKNDDDDMENQVVQVGDEKMPLKELVNKFQKLNSEKKNADDEDEKKKKEADEKKNADDEAAKKKEDEEKKNAKPANDGVIENSVDQKFFDELRNANLQKFKETPMVQPMANQLTRGKSRYGSATA